MMTVRADGGELGTHVYDFFENAVALPDDTVIIIALQYCEHLIPDEIQVLSNRCAEV